MKKPRRTELAVTRARRADAFTDAVGSSGLQQVAGVIREEFQRELVGQAGAETFAQMATNSVAGAILGLIRHLMAQAELFVTPAAADKTSEQWAAHVDQAMDEMERPWTSVMDEFHTGLIYGNSLHEIVYRVGTDGRWYWQGIRLRSQRSISRWVFEGETPVAAVQAIAGQPERHIPLNRCVHFKLSDVLQNPEGVSILRNGYQEWWYLQGYDELEGISLERNFAGFPVMEVPPTLLDSADPDDQARVQALIDAMSDIRRDRRAALLVPASEVEGLKTGYRFSFASANASGSPDFDTPIRRRQSRLAMTLFGDFLMLGHDNVGSFSLADRKTGLAATAIGAILDRFCETFTKQAIWPLMEVNGVPRQYWPKLDHGDIETPDLEVLANYVNVLVGARVLNPGPELEQYLRSTAKLPKAQEKTLDDPPPGDPDDPEDVTGELVPQGKRVAAAAAINHLMVAVERAQKSGSTELALLLRGKIETLLQQV